ncbi:MAG TPA: sugar ABC transporter permease [Deltaproteobacteria bacterium]|nr:sugar ABC transporter permease [Deltaproteobacteria bacterium]
MLAVFALYPALETVRLSLHRMVLTMPWLGEDFVGLENYVLLWRDGAMWSSLAVTLIFVAVTTAVELGAGLVTALVMNESFRWRGIFRAAVLVPWALPTVVASQMWRLLFNDRYGFVNYVLYGPSTELYRAWLADPASALAAVMIADIWKTSSFAALIILAGLQAIDDDLYRAAALDGAGPWRRFRLITLPLLRPALLVALLFRTIDAFRVFDLVFVMTQGGPADSTSVLQFYGYKQLFAYGDMGYGSAVSTFIFVVILLVSLFYVRFVAPAALSGERRP